MENASQDGEADKNGDTRSPGRSAIAGRRKVTVALLVAMMVAAVEQLIVSPAMPTIIAKLKGFDIYPWVISAYLLAATVSVPIYGKLADLFGRKPVLIFGLVLFSLGSMLSGTSMSMGQLIATRTIQGLGAGAVSPIVLTMLGDLFTLRERAQVQALFSAVWGLSSVAGPLIGGYLTDYIGWRWVFLICVPFAAAAILMLILYVSEPIVHRQVAPIDWAGAALLTAGVLAFLWVVLDGSRRSWAFNLLLLSGSAALLVLFVIRERIAADPILPMSLITRPVIAASLLASLAFGGILFGIETYVPLHVQGAQGGDATRAGLALIPLFLAWSASGALAARAVVRYGFRSCGLTGSILVAVGCLSLVTGASFPEWAWTCFMVALAVIGMGMGPTSLSFILAVQHAVNWGQRGVATGAAVFLRLIGGATGVGVLGGLLGWELMHRLARSGSTAIDVTAALRPETHKYLSHDHLRLVQTSLGLTLRDVYLLVTLLAIVSLICAFWLPDKHATLTNSSEQERESTRDEGPAAEV
ncbi:MAG: MDR family MFS transporter [Isosphaerales bacterium]